MKSSAIWYAAHCSVVRWGGLSSSSTVCFFGAAGHCLVPFGPLGGSVSLPGAPLYLLVGCSCRGAGYVEDCYLSHQHCRRDLGCPGEMVTVALVSTSSSPLRQYLPCSIARQGLKHGRWLCFRFQGDSQVQPFRVLRPPMQCSPRRIRAG